MATTTNDFDAAFQATVDSFLYWRGLLREADGLDYEDEIKYRKTINASKAHARREALHLLAMLKQDNGIE